CREGKLLSALCSLLCWISVSGSESQTVEVQSGEDVTLMCSGMDKHVSVRYWLKLVKGTDIQCVSTMTSYNSEVTYHDGFSNHTFTMSSNTSTIFLKVRSVDLNKSGIYYCGFNKDGHPFLTTIHLKIKGKIIFKFFSFSWIPSSHYFFQVMLKRKKNYLKISSIIKLSFIF
uniref:Ig-like domain-containing protein n=1 Tax=Labrus bergylta TaxID=56723 RepID=A0A3Q3E1S5_9LABR